MLVPVSLFLAAVLLIIIAPELARRLLTALYRLHVYLGKKWQLAITLAFQLVPAVDPYYAADGPVVTIDPVAANACSRFAPFCEALVAHLERRVGGLRGAFNQSLGVAPRALGRAVRANRGAAAFAARRHAMDPQRRFLNKFLDEATTGRKPAGCARG